MIVVECEQCASQEMCGLTHVDGVYWAGDDLGHTRVVSVVAGPYPDNTLN